MKIAAKHRRLFQTILAKRIRSREKAEADSNAKRREKVLKAYDDEIQALRAVIDAPIWETQNGGSPHHPAALDHAAPHVH